MDSSNQPKKSKKPIIIIAVIVGFIGLTIYANIDTKRQAKAKEEAAIAEESRISEEQAQQQQQEEYKSDADIYQERLASIYGQPPTGFVWSDDGDLIPLSDDSIMPEDILYQYLHSLTMLDISNAQKYSLNSRVVSTYKKYYEDATLSGYYLQFTRKLYSQTLQSIENEGIESEVLFAEGKRVYTLKLKIADLSYKDFWKEDKDTFFMNMYEYMVSESDSTKAKQYVYDKILEYYSSEDYAKREVTVEIVLAKYINGGWVVYDDSDLLMYVQYRDGTSVYEYIMSEYQNWLSNLRKQK